MSIVLTSTSIPLMAESARAPLVRTPGCESSAMTYSTASVSDELETARELGGHGDVRGPGTDAERRR